MRQAHPIFSTIKAIDPACLELCWGHKRAEIPTTKVRPFPILHPFVASPIVQVFDITMSAQTATQTPAAAQPPAKNLTPAQTAKPYGTAAKAAASRTAKKAEPAPAADAAKNDEATKAIEKLETKLKAM